MTFKISNNIAPCNIINRFLLVTEVKNWLVLGLLNPLKPSGNYMYHLLYQSVIVHSVFMGLV
jgi:hypothetical protein